MTRPFVSPVAGPLFTDVTVAPVGEKSATLLPSFTPSPFVSSLSANLTWPLDKSTLPAGNRAMLYVFVSSRPVTVYERALLVSLVAPKVLVSFGVTLYDWLSVGSLTRNVRQAWTAATRCLRPAYRPPAMACCEVRFGRVAPRERVPGAKRGSRGIPMVASVPPSERTAVRARSRLADGPRRFAATRRWCRDPRHRTQVTEARGRRRSRARRGHRELRGPAVHRCRVRRVAVGTTGGLAGPGRRRTSDLVAAFRRRRSEPSRVRSVRVRALSEGSMWSRRAVGLVPRRRGDDAGT